ncbi:MAG TPA: TIGR00730 family Rossman fold protein [Candidatus Angelobacter sp.]|nr:TIGR00730 family Rossman fold protein [Candidatus Angelobacter sp.]
MRICVFCGSSPGARPVYTTAARRLGELLAQRGIGLVYGGAHVGLMGTLADAVLAGGGEAVGVIPESLVKREIAHRGLTQLHVVETMHQRKAMMADLSDAVIALPGGFGTLEEFCEIVTWSKLGFQRKPCGLLNIDNYWNGLLTMFDRAVQDEFIHPNDRRMILEAETPEEMLNKLAACLVSLASGTRQVASTNRRTTV